MQRIYNFFLDEQLRRERQMLFLIGPRQVGKTTTSRAAGAQRSHSRYLNWDNLDHRTPIMAGPGRLASELQLDLLRDEAPLLVLDELHKYPSWRTLLKGFFDTYGDRCDILATGSARLSVFNVGGDSLMGRYFEYRMHPLSVGELAWVENGAPEPPHLEPGKRRPAPIPREAWETLLRFGGFPEPFLKAEDRFSVRWRRLRHRQLLREDLRDLTRIQETTKVEMLAQLLAAQAGQLSSYTSFSNGIDASIDSVKRWIETLEALYYGYSVRPWYRNLARALRKEPKYFLWDWAQVKDPGFRFENLVGSALLKAVHFWTDHGWGEFELRFVRDKGKREVDFLVIRDDQPWMLVEAKKSARPGLSPSLAHFHAELGTTHALQVAEDLDYIDRDVFQLRRPTIVPALTFLSQLV